MSQIPPPQTSTWSTVDQALQLICGGKGNLQTLGQLVAGLFDLGLAALVQPVIETINVPNPQWQTERESILAQARMLSTTTVNWSDREAIFLGNLDFLTSENPSLSNLKQYWSEHRDRFSLLQAIDGNFQIVDKQAPNIFAGLVGGLNDHRSLTRFWTWQSDGLKMPQPIAFDGAGYGWLLLRVLESTHRTYLNYSTAVYVIEPDLASACLLLNLHDLRPWCQRLRFFTGANALEEFHDGLKKNDHWLLPAFIFSERIQSRPPLDLQATLQTVIQTRKQDEQALLAGVNKHYVGITLSDWAARYQAAINGEKPLKILGIASRFTTVLQYSMDELGDAIRAAGHEFLLCKETDDQSKGQPDLQLIAEHKPDLLILISRMRYENSKLPVSVPFLCWDQDNLPYLRTEAATKSLDAFTYVAGAGARLGYEQLNWPKQNCILASQAAAATHRYHNGPVTEALLQKHRCTFSYTSTASASPQPLVEKFRNDHAKQPLVVALWDRAAEIILARANSGYAWDTARIGDLLDACLKEQKIEIAPASRQEMILDLRRLSDRAFRHVTLGWVVDYCRKNKTTLRLYGSGWESNPLFAEYAAGFLTPGEEMRAAFQASEINLQIIETGFLHSRVLDGLAAGGFFLNRLAPEARNWDDAEPARLIMAHRAIETGCVTFGQLDASTDPLIVGPWAHVRSVAGLGKPHERCRMLDIWIAAPSEDIQIPFLNEITFADQQQFNLMADRFLANPELRRDVAGRFRQLVVDRFSYDARWRQFLAGITDGLRDASGEAQAAFTTSQKKAA